MVKTVLVMLYRKLDRYENVSSFFISSVTRVQDIFIYFSGFTDLIC